MAERFVAEGVVEILAGAEKIFCLGLGREVVMSPGGILFGQVCQGTGRVCVGER